MTFHENKNCLCIATKQETARNMVTKVKFMYDNLPSWLKVPFEEKNKYINEWDNLNYNIKELINEQMTLEKELNEKSKLELKNDLLNEEINKLNSKNSQLIDNIEYHKNKLKEIEKNEDTISTKINTISKNLTELEKEKLLDDSLNKLNQIDLLWKYNPTWQERYIIENNVSLRDEFTPFTISQAFICFEKIIENLVVKNDESKKDLTLVEQINFIFEKGLLPSKFENDLHLVRKARNKWFHNGVQPPKEVFEILLDILDKTKTSPLL
jgi:ribosomal protein S16